jgi:hypothetical protein
MKQWSEDMGEISGFGGSYEAACRAMVLAGIAWVDEHPNEELSYRGFKGVFGVLTETSLGALALDKAMMDATIIGNDGQPMRVGSDCTGAMHHAAVQHVLAYKRLGWEEYCRQLREREDK